eukprot:TRINITY_DN3057_c0_g1_i3.p1 TRINITY_DN3057_c0_g1~~TRINITY_DN3057_c0_g1_i3.p1  ORF type:complete len:190 (+),score=4.55 TRINITY_DN3057_c0_g1_i3:1-570(+)
MSNPFSILATDSTSAKERKTKTKTKSKSISIPSKSQKAPQGFKKVANKKKGRKKKLVIESRVPVSEKYKWMYCPPVLQIIFSHLRSLRDILNCSEVTSSWHHVLQTDSASWVEVMKSESIADYKIERVMRLKDKAEGVKLAKSYLMDELRKEEGDLDFYQIIDGPVRTKMKNSRRKATVLYQTFQRHYW